MMRLSTRARYGTRALLELALHWGEGPISLKDIAESQEVSEAYLQRLFRPLVAANLVTSTRGPKGGVLLLKPPGEVSLSEIIRLLEGPLGPVDCIANPDLCPRSDLCVTRDIWREMKLAINGVLHSTTLKDLVERHREKEQPRALMYYI